MSANLTTEETASRAAAVELHSYDVTLDLSDAEHLEQPTFPARSAISLTSQTPETWLDYISEAVTAVMIDGRMRPVEFDGSRIWLRDLPVGRPVTVVVEGASLFSRSGEGLHRFRDPADGQVYLYTQYEPADARRVFPCFEQPDMKAPFSFTVIGPERWRFLGNQPVVARNPGYEGTVWVKFAPTPVMSTFITCICAGPYHLVEDSWKSGDGRTKVPLGLLCRQSMAEYLDAGELFRVTKAGLDDLQVTFGDYVWGKYDQVFVPEYNLGAMENPGLVTFTEQYLFRSQATPAQYQGRANTLLHEMSHMWFGDLVTPRWWSDLWLKESFAEFMGTHLSGAAAGFEDAWLNFAVARKAGAYVADSLPTTHPVVADIPDLEAAKNNFDRITYSKGAAALTQLVHYVGLEDFFAGCRLYFARHAYGAATLWDFLAALAETSGKDLHSWSRVWLETSGFDELTVQAQVADGRVTAAELRRVPAGAAEPADRPHATTVGVYDLADGRLVLRERLDIVAAAAVTDLPGLAGASVPAALIPNDADQTYAAIALDDTTRGALLARLSDLEPLTRAVAWQSLRTDLREARLPVLDFVTAVLRHGRLEDRPGVLTSLLHEVADALRRYVPAGQRPELAALWGASCLERSRESVPGSDGQLLWAKAFLRAAGLAPLDVRPVLAGAIPGLEVSTDLRWLALQSLAEQGDVTEAELDAALAADRTAAGEMAHLQAWFSRPDPLLKREAWERAHVVGGETNDAVDALMAGVFAQGDSPLADEFAAPYFDGLLDVWAQHPIEIARRLVIQGYPHHVKHLGASAAWLEGNPDAPGALRRLLVELDAELRIAARVQAG